MTDLEIALYLMSHEEKEMLIRYILLYLQQYRKRNEDEATTQGKNDKKYHSQHAS